ncbi:MAG: DNA polymerase IV, partial [Planctomycetota bacterium]
MILHVDMDAFYAAVEQRDRPELAGRPVVVGGDPKSRGVVSAASYEARSFGVHSAMPSAEAVRLCPHATFLPPRIGHYAEISRQIRSVFDRYTPLVEPLSLDEAFLDVSGSVGLLGPPAQMARKIKQEVRQEVCLVASVGVAPNKFLAKIASDLEKPDGLVVVHAEGVRQFLDPLPVGRLWGVGHVSNQAFERLGIRTVGQLRRLPLETLRDRFGSL